MPDLNLPSTRQRVKKPALQTGGVESCRDENQRLAIDDARVGLQSGDRSTQHVCFVHERMSLEKLLVRVEQHHNVFGFCRTLQMEFVEIVGADPGQSQ